MNCFSAEDVLCTLALVDKHWNRHARAPDSFAHAIWNTRTLCRVAPNSAARGDVHLDVIAQCVASVEDRISKYAPLIHSLVVDVGQDQELFLAATPAAITRVNIGRLDKSTVGLIADAYILGRVMQSSPDLFRRLTSVCLMNVCGGNSNASRPLFDVDIQAMANITSATIEVTGNELYLHEAHAYAFAKSPHLRELTVIDSHSGMSVDQIRDTLELHTGKIRTFNLYAALDDRALFRWLYAVCHMRAITSLNIVDTRKGTDLGRRSICDASIAILARIPTLARLRITQTWKAPNRRTMVSLDAPLTGAAADLARHLDGEGITTNGVFSALECIDIPGSNIWPHQWEAISRMFPALRCMTLAEYDNGEVSFVTGVFAVIPTLHCLVYRAEAPSFVYGVNMADVARTLFESPSAPIYTAVVSSDRVYQRGMFMAVRPRTVYRLPRQSQPHMYLVSSCDVAPSEFRPDCRSVVLAMGSICHTGTGSKYSESYLDYYDDSFRMSASAVIVLTHMGRVPNCTQPMRTA
jgi:hypothetical protein